MSGQRCAPGGACACATTAPCTAPSVRTRLVIGSERAGFPTRWQWVDSMPTSFDDPTASADYRVCVETADDGFTETALHGSEWRATRTGFRYRSATGPVRSMVLKSTAAKTIVTTSLAPTAAFSLPLTSPVRVRLVRTGANPACFEAEFANPLVNTESRYVARE